MLRDLVLTLLHVVCVPTLDGNAVLDGPQNSVRERRPPLQRWQLIVDGLLIAVSCLGNCLSEQAFYPHIKLAEVVVAGIGGTARDRTLSKL